MKRETWKQLLQIIITILTAITTTLTTTSCVRSHLSSSTARHIGLTKRHLPTRLTETTASGAGSSASATIMWCDATARLNLDGRNG